MPSILQAMLREARMNGFKVRFHGNGFIQFPFVPMVRLHVWSPELRAKPDHNAAIHDHVWGMTSDILLGRLNHHTYDVVPGDLYKSRYDIYSVGRADEEGLGGMLDTGVGLRGTGTYELPVGAQYTFAEDCLHESTNGCGGLTATLMRKHHHGAPIERRPRIACPLGETPSDAFAAADQPSQETMLAIIEAAISEMSEPSLKQLERVLS